MGICKVRGVSKYMHYRHVSAILRREYTNSVMHNYMKQQHILSVR